jgi:hypothetical protein
MSFAVDGLHSLTPVRFTPPFDLFLLWREREVCPGSRVRKLEQRTEQFSGAGLFLFRAEDIRDQFGCAGISNSFD